jgi:hypothetical protein
MGVEDHFIYFIVAKLKQYNHLHSYLNCLAQNFRVLELFSVRCKEGEQGRGKEREDI